MYQSIVLLLLPTMDQERSLRDTIRAFNLATQHVADICFERKTANKVLLQPIVYSELRSQFNLSSQMAVRALSRACESYKRDKKGISQFADDDPMILDSRLMSIKGLTHVSILALEGRVLVPFRVEGYIDAHPDRIPTQGDLFEEDNQWILHLCINFASVAVSTNSVNMIPGATLPLLRPLSESLLRPRPVGFAEPRRRGGPPSRRSLYRKDQEGF